MKSVQALKHACIKQGCFNEHSLISNHVSRLFPHLSYKERKIGLRRYEIESFKLKLEYRALCMVLTIVSEQRYENEKTGGG